MREVFLSLALLSGCGGAPSTAEPPAQESAEAVTEIAVTPTDLETSGGGREVIIDEQEGVDAWLASEVFSSTVWERKGDSSPARYVVTFRAQDRVVARYFLGTSEGEAVEYRCFGLCAKWWVAPSQEDGTQDPLRYRVLSDEVWHPLARQWYLFSK